MMKAPTFTLAGYGAGGCVLALGIYRLLVDDVGCQPRLCNGSGVLEVELL